MRNLLTNPIKYNHIIVIEALLLTLAIHLVLFVLFSYAAPKKYYENENDVSITLLNVDNLNELEREKLNQFLINNNPAMMTQSNSTYGFDSILNFRKTVPFSEEILLGNKRDKFIIEYEKPEFIVNKSVDTQKKFTRINNFDNPIPVTINKNELKYPIAIGSDGSIIPLVLSKEEEKFIEKYLIKNTVIKVNKDSDTLLRLNIIQSSGRRDFDLLSCKLLNKELSSNDNLDNGIIYSIYYQEDSP